MIQMSVWQFGFLVLLILLGFGFFVWHEKMHERERRELYSRLMARSLEEYQALTDLRGPPKGGSFIRVPKDRYPTQEPEE